MANAVGTPIHAPTDAVVLLTDDFHLEGGFTLLDHGHGVTTHYMHQSKRLVQEGDVLKRGDTIGKIGMTGRATGPHLHWGMNWFAVRLDPSLSTRTPAPPPA
jgi:murein DD-endopeptidase MepM/ murein hydrolase activator NlpD